uniref:Calcium-binding protein 39 n=1 Tax=Chlamydomonas leiostraca TaxID=1034604 RepID=A0A7S0RI09_9CHLO|mmetsp:Transcript_23450/g.60045  ORF Transcript_23450/g.60045 Transcript_23450/m.60045 type:complete len:351 (+) Transcript_23450:184-1236(+)
MPLLDKLLKEKPKSAQDTIAKLIASFNALEVGGDTKAHEKALESVSKYLKFLKIYLFGDEEREVTKEGVLELTKELMATDLLYLLTKHLSSLDFETRKDAAQVFGATVRIRDADDKSPGAHYVLQHPYIVNKLCAGFEDTSIALNCGQMLRDCIRDEAVAKSLLDNKPMFMEFFEKVEVANFEIASDAFSTFKDLLTRHKAIVAQYLQENYAEFFPAYVKLLQSGNYVTRRQSLKLLGELLLDRSNVKVMVKFVGEVQHLMLLMMLLKDPSRSIQFEAFHVFKVFVANPAKPQPITDILANNRDKLLKYLEEFHTDKDDDEQFKEEKAVIIKEISMLGAPPPAPAPPASS